MPKRRKSINIDRWVKRHQNKHLCACGCGEYIVVKREHHKPSVGIPTVVPGHNLTMKTPPPASPPTEESKESIWDKLSDEEKERRLSQLKSFGTGEDNPSWKGGRRFDEHGYVQIRMPEHPFANDGYVFEHRMVVEERTRKNDPNNRLLVEVGGQKYLSPKAVVHHIDENKSNNKSSNLMLLPHQKAHAFIHNSPLPMKERIRRIEMGVYHSDPIDN